MPIARPESSDSRIIAHLDMDCFYVQVEQRRQPGLRGLPSAVVQYNEWKGGGLIAVSYEARKYGVKRSMRGEEAKEVCPEIQLVQVPVARGKADLNTYRNAGSEVVSILARKGRCERASIDEVYLDLTLAAGKMLAESPPDGLEFVDEETLKSHILGLTNKRGIDPKENVREWMCRKEADHRDKLLACGALIVSELRMQVLKETEFTCSAGIAHNKIMAKLASGMNKPAQQTVVPHSSVKELLDSLPIKKMKQLGGKLGSSLQDDMGVSTVGDLLQFTEKKLQDRFGVNTGTWLWNIARGICGEEVQGRLLPKSHGSGKSFPGPRALRTIANVQHWLNELCDELSERLQTDLEQNKRIARTLTLHVSAFKPSDSDSQKNFASKSCPLRYGFAKMQEDAFNLFQAGLREFMGSHNGSHHNGWRITGLSVSASKIVEISSGTSSIMSYFQCQCPTSKQTKNDIQEAVRHSPSTDESCSDVNLIDQQTEFPGEDAKSKLDVRCSDQQEHRNEFCEDQGRDDITREASFFTSGTESCMGVNQAASALVEPSKHGAVSNLNRLEQNRKTSKEKGTNSILRFFKKTDPSCSSKDENAHNLQDVEAPSSAGIPGLPALTGTHRREERRGWSYKVDEIDPSVIAELPLEIQDEFRAWLPANKRPKTTKRGSNIDHYFLPRR